MHLFNRNFKIHLAGWESKNLKWKKEVGSKDKNMEIKRRQKNKNKCHVRCRMDVRGLQKTNLSRDTRDVQRVAMRAKRIEQTCCR